MRLFAKIDGSANNRFDRAWMVTPPFDLDWRAAGLLKPVAYDVSLHGVAAAEVYQHGKSQAQVYIPGVSTVDVYQHGTSAAQVYIPGISAVQLEAQ